MSEPYPGCPVMEGRKGHWMTTFSGRRFWPLDPRPEEAHIEDIAHHLSLICRYGGATAGHYSVAEHSVLISEYAEHGLGRTPHEAMQALLHDAHEAYTGDIIRPIKACVATISDVIERIQHDIQLAVCRRFKIPEPPLPDWLYELDKYGMILAEKDQVIHPDCPDFAINREEHATPDIKIECWPAPEAEATASWRASASPSRTAPSTTCHCATCAATTSRTPSKRFVTYVTRPARSPESWSAPI